MFLLSLVDTELSFLTAGPNSSPCPLPDAWLQAYKNRSYTAVMIFHKYFYLLTLEARQIYLPDSPRRSNFSTHATASGGLVSVFSLTF